MDKQGAEMRGFVARMGLLLAALAGGTVLGGGAVQAEGQTHKGYEMPPYRVERVEDGQELRAYGPHLVAEVTVRGDRSTAVGRGFSVLAGYIFGGNQGGEKLAMTVPVAQTPETGEGDLWVVRFMMPRDQTLDSLPRPSDDRIRLVALPGDRQVVTVFSGLPDTADLAARAEALRAWAEGAGLTVLAGPHYYFYDGPMTLPWNRRNEVAFTIR